MPCFFVIYFIYNEYNILMKKIKKILSYIIIIISILLIPFSIKGYIKVNAFNNFILCIDPGHGGLDVK